MVTMISSNSYREIVEGIDDGVVLLDRDARCLYVNPSGERILGATLDQVARQTIWEAAEDTIGIAARAAYEQLLAGQEVQLLQNYFVRGCWYEVYGRPTHDGILMLFRDVTERLQAEAARLSVEQRFQLLVDGVKDYAIILMDLQGRVVTWNKGAERINGYRPDEIIGQHFSVFYPPDEQDKSRRALECAVGRGRFEEEGWRVKKGGSRYFATVVITPLYNELGQASGFAKVVRDITDRRSAEDALRLSEERLRLAADAGKVGLLDYCPTTGEVIWDRRCKELWGLPSDAKVTYDGWLERVHPEDRPRVDTAISQALQPASGGELDDEFRTAQVNGGEHWIAVRGKVCFDDTARPQRFFGTMRDVTEQHHLDQLRDRLSGVFAHDLRAPLSAIRMASSLLVGATAEELRVAAEIIVRGADRMTRMIEQLMDFTRVRLGGGMPLRRERVDLSSLCRELAAEAEAAHPGARVRCISSGDCVGSWDLSQVGRILTNLIGNALQHGCRNSPVEVTIRGERESVVLLVHNQGTPIPVDLLRVIFDPFRSGDCRARTRGAGGLGLGLFITRALVQAHNGEIDVRSTAKEGTTFCVRLPRARQQVGLRAPSELGR